jgi:YVTN family beta-propeller protein
VALALIGAGVIVYLNLRPSARPSAAGSGGTPSASASAPASAAASQSAGAAPTTAVVANQFPAFAGTISDPTMKSANFVAVAPNGQQLYVADPIGQQILVVDTATNKVSGHFPISAGPPQFLAFAPKLNKLFVSVWDKAGTVPPEVAVVDTKTNAVVKTIRMDSNPMLAAVTPDEKRVFVPTHDTNAVAVLDTTTYQVLKKFTVPPNPHAVSFTPDGSEVFIADHDSNKVTVVKTSDYSTVAQINVPTAPHNVAVHPDPKRHLAVVACFGAKRVALIDTDTNRVTATIGVGLEPQYVTFSADGRLAYVVDDGDNTLAVVNLDTRKNTGANVTTGTAPTSMAVLPGGSKGYVSNVDGRTLTVLNLGS